MSGPSKLNRVRSLVLAAGMAAGLAVSLSAASAWATLDADERVRLEECPAAVRTTIENAMARQARLSGGAITEIERTTDHGRILFEVDVKTEDGIVEFDVAADGTFVGFEDGGPEDEDDGEDPEDEADEADEDDEEDDDDDQNEGQDDDHIGEIGPARDGDVLIPTPLADRARFTPTITHPYFPLSEVRWSEMRADDARVVREVLDRTRVVAGVECLILAEHEYERRGAEEELVEISYNFFAQDEGGNVYYFGEDVDDYKDGEVVGHGGAWLVGRNAVEPCLFMPADLEIGMVFKPENSPPQASEWAIVGSITCEIEVPGGEFEGVLIMLESNHDDHWEERKYYARGIGLISENRTLNLVEAKVSAASPESVLP